MSTTTINGSEIPRQETTLSGPSGTTTPRNAQIHSAFFKDSFLQNFKYKSVETDTINAGGSHGSITGSIDQKDLSFTETDKHNRPEKVSIFPLNKFIFSLADRMNNSVIRFTRSMSIGSLITGMAILSAASGGVIPLAASVGFAVGLTISVFVFTISAAGHAREAYNTAIEKGEDGKKAVLESIVNSLKTLAKGMVAGACLSIFLSVGIDFLSNIGFFHAAAAGITASSSAVTAAIKETTIATTATTVDILNNIESVAYIVTGNVDKALINKFRNRIRRKKKMYKPENMEKAVEEFRNDFIEKFRKDIGNIHKEFPEVQYSNKLKGNSFSVSKKRIEDMDHINSYKIESINKNIESFERMCRLIQNKIDGKMENIRNGFYKDKNEKKDTEKERMDINREIRIENDPEFSALQEIIKGKLARAREQLLTDPVKNYREIMKTETAIFMVSTAGYKLKCYDIITDFFVENEYSAGNTDDMIMDERIMKTRNKMEEFRNDYAKKIKKQYLGGFKPEPRQGAGKKERIRDDLPDSGVFTGKDTKKTAPFKYIGILNSHYEDISRAFLLFDNYLDYREADALRLKIQMPGSAAKEDRLPEWTKRFLEKYGVSAGGPGKTSGKLIEEFYEKMEKKARAEDTGMQKIFNYDMEDIFRYFMKKIPDIRIGGQKKPENHGDKGKKSEGKPVILPVILNVHRTGFERFIS